jgi:WD40-like Beta Propeller Repeat
LRVEPAGPSAAPDSPRRSRLLAQQRYPPRRAERRQLSDREARSRGQRREDRRVRSVRRRRRDYLIFASDRPDSLGNADLYVSFRVDGAWQPARNLGPAINSKHFEYCPIMSPDGAHFFFTSCKRPDAPPPERPASLAQLIAAFDEIENGLGNIYWLKADFLEQMRAGGAPP